MSRKQFIESQGATCRNWTWSWSFINSRDKVIIFGAWNRHTKGNKSLILSEDWEIGPGGKKQPGYKQAREHIRLVESGAYKLKTFPMIYSDANENEKGIGPAKIGDFISELRTRALEKIGEKWYATDDPARPIFPGEVDSPEQYREGTLQQVSVNAYERNPEARAKCIAYHGYICVACHFNFECEYGPIGKGYIHVHHIVPLSEIRKEYEVNPIKDLVPLCPNCHAMIHRAHPTLTINQLKKHLGKGRKLSH